MVLACFLSSQVYNKLSNHKHWMVRHIHINIWFCTPAGSQKSLYNCLRYNHHNSIMSFFMCVRHNPPPVSSICFNKFEKLSCHVITLFNLSNKLLLIIEMHFGIGSPFHGNPGGSLIRMSCGDHPLCVCYIFYNNDIIIEIYTQYYNFYILMCITQCTVKCIITNTIT